ncbi:MAG: HlyD family secretion protein [Thermoanaerobaculia bacterium]
MKVLPAVIVLLLVGTGVGGYFFAHRTAETLTLTGIVTTNDVVVSSQLAGRIGRLLVREGDVVKRGQLAAVLEPDELRQESAFYAHSARGAMSQVEESAAALRLQERQTADQIRQAEATLAAIVSQRAAAQAEFENARLTAERLQKMADQGVVPVERFDQARTARDAARARLASLARQVDAQRSVVAVTRASAEQVLVRRSELESARRQQEAADAQRARADIRLAYAELRAPIDGVVNVLVARAGEFVEAGQPVLALIDPDELWVRADVEETYIDRVRIGDRLTVRLPSGAERQGTVFFRAADAGFATQRDVSRAKRDIRTFEIRLRVDNADRRLAVGMTAYVLLPVQ